MREPRCRMSSPAMGVAVIAAIAFAFASAPPAARADVHFGASVHGAFTEPVGGCEEHETCLIEGELGGATAGVFGGHLRQSGEGDEKCGAKIVAFPVFTGSAIYEVRGDPQGAGIKLRLALTSGSYGEGSCPNGEAPYSYGLKWSITSAELPPYIKPCVTGGTLEEAGTSEGTPRLGVKGEAILYSGTLTGTITGCDVRASETSIECQQASSVAFLCLVSAQQAGTEGAAALGTVTFTSTGGGAFPAGDSCALELEAGVSRCTVLFDAPEGGASVIASLHGDILLEGSSAISSRLVPGLGPESNFPFGTGATRLAAFCDASCQACGPTAPEASCHLPSRVEKQAAGARVAAGQRLSQELHGWATAFMSSPDWATAGAKVEVEAASLDSEVAAWNQIANDPFDPAWRSIYRPQSRGVAALAAGLPLAKRAARRLIRLERAQTRGAELVEAVSISINRANSAVRSGNTAVGEEQVAAARTYAREGASAFEKAIRLAAKARKALRGVKSPIVSAAEFRAFQLGVASHGLPPALIKALAAAGLAGNESALIAEIVRSTPIEPPRSLRAVMAAAGGVSADEQSALDLASIADTLH